MSNANELPDAVYFRDNLETFNSAYYAAVRDRGIWVKPRAEATGSDGPWQKLALMPSLEGDVLEIAMDDEHIIALNGEREIHTMWNALNGIADFKWQREWGLPFWRGSGMVLPDLFIKWDFSVVSRRLDQHYTDPAGNSIEIGFAKCSHIIALNRDGQRITLNDPWLPADLSYEIPLPKRGRFIAVNSSASGATTFIINRYGDMYTRVFDLDLSGMDSLFMRGSYWPQTGAARPLIQLPTFDWVMQPKVRGEITDRISTVKLGVGCVNRTLRVEGLDDRGNTGCWEKDITGRLSDDWRFRRTDQPIRGNLLDNRSYDSSTETLGYSEDHSYGKDRDPSHDWKGELKDFNCYVTPIVLEITLSDGASFDLILHTHDCIRLFRRARGLDEEPRKIAGAIEIPAKLLENLRGQGSKVRQYIARYFSNRRFTDVTIYATSSEVKIVSVGWLFASWRFALRE